MGPGPLEIHPRVYQALTSPVIGYLDPDYLKILDQIGDRLRMVFQTQNRATNAMPGTGTSGMEACVANLIEPGDKVLVCVHGYFGDRLRQMVERQEAQRHCPCLPVRVGTTTSTHRRDPPVAGHPPEHDRAGRGRGAGKSQPTPGSRATRISTVRS